MTSETDHKIAAMGDLCASMEALLAQAVATGADADGLQLTRWTDTLSRIRDQASGEWLRVAVVGSIKSGKSTFVNALYRGDYLKRGAGVVTSFVTRIHTGPALSAALDFKSWDEVNDDIRRALVLVPTDVTGLDPDGFDIRREADRQALGDALNQLDPDRLMADGTRDANGVRLWCYLRGFNRVRQMVSADARTTRYPGDRFARHQEFVGNDDLAVYLKNVLLDIDTDRIAANIEVADCQGSDSPNPLHLAMIQDYLMLTHLIIYVISSRTGLRQADMRFLTMIKKMGIADNLLFVVNCDFSEHNGRAELDTLLDRVRDELAWVVPSARLYAQSALYHLFETMADVLPEKDRLRLDQWRLDKDLVSMSTLDAQRFETDFVGRLEQERQTLLVDNPLAQLRLVAQGLAHWLSLRQDFLGHDSEAAKALMARLREHRTRQDRIRELIKNTLDGAQGRIRRSLRSEIDQFFSQRPERILGRALDFVSGYHAQWDRYREKLAGSGLASTLYWVYQDFQQAMDRFMAETINPELGRFVRDVEQQIRSSLAEVLDPFEAMATDLVDQYRDALMDTGVPVVSSARFMPDLDMAAVRRMAQAAVPTVGAPVRLSARVKAETALRFGAYRLFARVRAAMNKSAREGDDVAPLAQALRQIKREAEGALIFHFKNYRENIKFQYVFKLLDAAAGYMQQQLMDRLDATDTDLTALADLLNRQGTERADLVRRLAKMTDAVNGILDRMGALSAAAIPSPPQGEAR